MTLKEFKARKKLNNGYDRKIGEWKIIDIHQIPEIMLEQHEIDFYCSNGRNVYLLRLRNREKEMFCVNRGKNSWETTAYLIAELPISTINNQLLHSILNKFSVEYLNSQ